MTEAIFFRLLHEDVQDKPAALETYIAALNEGSIQGDSFTISVSVFRIISGTPFAYWAKCLIELMDKFPKLQPSFGTVIRGPEVFDLEESVRIWTEVLPRDLGITAKWVDYAKGGESSRYTSNLHLVVDYGSVHDGVRSFRRPGDPKFYFLSGLTFTQRTSSAFASRILNSNALTSPKGPGIVPTELDYSWYLLGISNTTIFGRLVELKVGAGDAAARSYDLNILRKIPIPIPSQMLLLEIKKIVNYAYDLQLSRDLNDETTHVFSFPGLVAGPRVSLTAISRTLEATATKRHDEFTRVQAEIDRIVFDLYGLTETDRQLVMHEMGTTSLEAGDTPAGDIDEAEDDGAVPEDLPVRVQNLLMWCVGVAFGRWDVRKALDPRLLPALPGPFDPLPRCAPGALMDGAGLPLERDDLPTDYPLPIAWDGVLLDDPAQEDNPHSHDIVARVRGVLTLLWGDQADAIEQEACGVLEVRDLRDYFRNPSKGFFNFHIKRYSKSRRKAPIYWLLQSEKRNFALWMYYPRITLNTLFVAENVLYDMLQRESLRLDDQREMLIAAVGPERKQHERQIQRQTQRLEELKTYYTSVRELANLKLPPDHNDGVLISIAPLHPVVPWPEATKMWDKLLQGGYSWSHMSAQMRRRGLIKS